MRMDREGDHHSGSSAARSRASSSRRAGAFRVGGRGVGSEEVGEAGIGGTPCVHVFVNREKRAHIGGEDEDEA